MKRWLCAGVLACAVLGWTWSATAEDGKGAVSYGIVLKGTSNTLAGQKFPFTASGTMTWNETTGEVTFSVVTSVSVPFTGAGTLARGAKSSYAVTTFDSGSATGSAVFVGKFSSDRSQFSGKFQAGSPNRVGPAPGGFVFTTGSIKAVRD